MNKPMVLIVEDDSSMRFVLNECLKNEKYDTMLAVDGKQAIELFKSHLPDLVLLDLKIPKIKGMEVFRQIKKLNQEAIIIILTAYATINTAVEAMKEGAYDFVPKPFELEQLILTVDNALKKRRIIKENRAAQEGVMDSEDSIYNAKASINTSKIDDIISSVALSDYAVLVEGESGTGKSLIAEEIHHRSNRKDGPFVRVDCASLPASLIESELFGYEKGAFTGAINKKIGKIERAHGGTLFLDEISTLDQNGQASLLSLIQNQEFERIGGTRTQKIDIRVIAASNQDLKQMVKEKTFRIDLYYRLNVFNIIMPPLKQRGEDIIPLSYYFIRKFSNRNDIVLSPEAAMKLKNYDWPGNIRELENAIKHALILVGDEPIIESTHLPLELNQGYWAFREKNLGLKEILETTERNIIQQVLLENDLDIEKSAIALKVSKRTLYYRISKANVDLTMTRSSLKKRND